MQEVRQRICINGSISIFIQIERGWNNGVFFWVPAHVEVSGNGVADKLAKKALCEMEVDVNLTMGGKGGEVHLKKKLMNKWQIRWDNSSTWRWYYSIMQTVGRINCAI